MNTTRDIMYGGAVSHVRRKFNIMAPFANKLYYSRLRPTAVRRRAGGQCRSLLSAPWLQPGFNYTLLTVYLRGRLHCLATVIYAYVMFTREAVDFPPS